MHAVIAACGPHDNWCGYGVNGKYGPKGGDRADDNGTSPRGAPPTRDTTALQWASRPASAPLFVNVGAGGKTLYADRAGRVFEKDGSRHRGNWNVWDDPKIGRAVGSTFESHVAKRALKTPEWAISRIKAAITTPKGGGGVGTNSPAARRLPLASGGGGIIPRINVGSSSINPLVIIGGLAAAFFAYKMIR